MAIQHTLRSSAADPGAYMHRLQPDFLVVSIQAEGHVISVQLHLELMQSLSAKSLLTNQPCKRTSAASSKQVYMSLLEYHQDTSRGPARTGFTLMQGCCRVQHLCADMKSNGLKARSFPCTADKHLCRATLFVCHLCTLMLVMCFSENHADRDGTMIRAHERQDVRPIYIQQHLQ